MNINAFRQILLSTVLFMSTQAMSECNPQAYLGSICWMAGDYCPRGYAKANGQMMPISDNTALFSLLSTNYGGDGRVTFQLPDLMGRVAIGEGVGPGMIPRRLSQRVGAEKRMLYPNQVPGQHALTLSNLSYRGSVAAVTETGTTNSPAGNYPAQSAVGKFYDPVGESQFHSGSIEITSPVNLTLTTDSAGSPAKGTIFLREPQLGANGLYKYHGALPSKKLTGLIIMTIAILGGGLAGSLCALALAKKGLQVTLYEQASVLLGAASLHNEGKLHLGYVYAADPFKQTYKTMIEGCARFFSVLASCTGLDQAAFIRSKPFYYAVLPDSQLPAELIRQHFMRVDEEMARAGLALSGFTDCSSKELARHFNPENIQAAFKTSEFSVDPQHLASAVYASVMQDKNIRVLVQHEVTQTMDEGGDYAVITQSCNGQQTERYTHVVNCLWQNRMRFDRMVGLNEHRPYLLRYKATLRFYIPTIQKTPLKDLVSATYITGPFGDVVNYQNGYLYLSWYPFSKLHESSSDELAAFDNALLNLDKKAFIMQSIDALSQYQPALLALHGYQDRAVVAGGYIFAWGYTDIDDPNSELHQRHDIGLHQKERWLSLDTGKFTTAPLLAMQAADRVSMMLSEQADSAKGVVCNRN